MKSSVSLTQLFLIALAAFLAPSVTMGQRSDESVRVKVHKTQEGHTLQIEEDVPAGDAQDLQQLINKYGMTDELKELKPGEEVEIVIRRTQGGDKVDDVTIEMDRKPAVTPIPTPTPTPTPTPPITTKPVEKKPAFLGVHYEMEYGSTHGSHITKVEPGTPAFKAGLKAGDVITKADDIELFQLEDLADIIGKKKAGDKVKISFVREGKASTTYVTLAERDEEFFKNNPGGGPTYRIEQMYEEAPGSGLWIEEDRVRDLTDDNGSPLLGVIMIESEKRIIVNGATTVEKKDGALVDDVITKSAAAEIGMRKGDKIIEVNGKPVASATEVTTMIRSMEAGDRVTVAYLRDGERHTGSANLKNREGFDLPVVGSVDKDVVRMRGDEEAEPGVFDRMHAMMDEALSRANGNLGTNTVVREFRILIKMDQLSPAEAQALSAKTGQSIKADSDLELREVELSPNPSTGKFHIGFDLPAKGTAKIEVMDMNGQCVYSEVINDFQGNYNKDFDISQEAKGIYVMRITQNGKSFTRKIITQ